MLLPPGLLPDMCTCACINTISDILAQQRSPVDPSILLNSGSSILNSTLLTSLPLDLSRTQNYLRFGLFDGALSHYWFTTLDSTLSPLPPTVPILPLQVSLDAFLYTPLWCVWYLTYISITTPSSPSPLDSLRQSWLELYRGNLGFFLPLTCLIYAFVPTPSKVLAFGAASLFYTTVLSAWNAGRIKGDLREGGGKDEGRRLGVRFRWVMRGLRREIPTMDDLDEFLDRPVFTPESVTGGPFQWFADLVKDDYGSAEVLYVSVIFFLLVEVGMAWLRLELNK
jgi:hypothetical protein